MLPSLILTYHAIEAGPAPLCVEPALFREQLDCMVESGAHAVGVTELALSLESDGPEQQRIAITFDDGFASVAEYAAPLLLERGLTATVYCVAGHLGGRNEWPSARAGGFESRLADRAALVSLSRAGLEIGSHGTAHSPLVTEDALLLQRELVESRATLEETLETSVRSFAYPYGAAPSVAARRLVESTYAAACTTRLGEVFPSADLYALPRIDVHYLRSPERLRRALEGSLGSYLRARRAGARVRRALRRDYARVA